MPSRQEQRNFSIAIKKSVSKCRNVSLEKQITNITQTELIIPYHDSIFHSQKHENKGVGNGTAKDMEMLHSSLVERGWREVELLDKKGTTLGFLLCTQTFLSVL